MTHLRDRVAALVDGELGHDARDRALAHVAGCAECRQELEAHRRVKAMLASTSEPRAAQELRLRLRLLAQDQPRPLRAEVPPLPTPVRPLRRPTPARPSTRRRGPGRHPEGRSGQVRPGAQVRSAGRRTLAHRSALASAGALSVVAVVLGGAFVLGGSPTQPVLRPPVDTFSVQHAVSTDDMSLSDPVVGAVTASFVPGEPAPGPATR